MLDVWFVLQKGRRFGPLTREEVAELVRKRSLKLNALAWRPGMAQWEALSSCVGVANPAEPLAETLEPPPPNPHRHVGPIVLFLFAFIFGVYAVLFAYEHYYQFGAAAPFVHAGFWIAALLVAFITAFLMARWSRNAPGWRWPALRVASVMLLMITAAYSVNFARISLTIDDIVAARGDYGQYELSFDTNSNTLSFEGNIGPQFGDRLADALALNPTAQTLVINSPGGLLDEAMRAGRVIEAHPQLAVHIDGECSSACIVLFMAAQQRRADAISTFGFHRSSSVTPLPAFIAPEERWDADVRQFVVERGFPAETFDSLTANVEIQAVTAIELADIHVVTHLVSEGETIDADRAKWLWIAAATEQHQDGFSELARALAGSNDRLLLGESAAVFTAVRAGDDARARGLVAGLMNTLVPRAIESGDPALARAYMRASNASITHLISTRAWDQCAAIIDGTGGNGAVPQEILRAEIVALADTVRSASQAGWPRRALAPWARGAGDALIAQTRQQGWERGINPDRFDTDARTKCILSSELLDNVAAQEPARAAMIYRYIYNTPLDDEPTPAPAAPEPRQLAPAPKE